MAKLPVLKSPDAEPEAEKTPNGSPVAICKHVMGVLGRPADFLRITVRQVGSERYRVNVVAGPDLASARIAHSYFITADDAGNVTASSPRIVKQY